MPVPRQFENAFIIEASFDRTWAAVNESFADLQWPIQDSEKTSGQITTDWIKCVGQESLGYCECGELGLIAEENLRVKILVILKISTENSCEMMDNFTFEQICSNLEGTKHFIRKCVSTGRLETKLYEMVNSKVQKQKS